MRIGFLGLGKMGSAILNGVINSSLNVELYAYHPHKEIRTMYQNVYFVENELELYESVDIFLFCVKPQKFPEIYKVLESAKKKPNLIVSIAAGITIKNIQDALEIGKVIRVMPNTSCAYKMGVSTIAYSNDVSTEELNLIKNIFDYIGYSYIVAEDEINLILPLNGSFPAYFYYYVNSFIQSASKHGISPIVAREVLLRTIIGCSSSALQDKRPINELINDICSKGGTTIEGLKVLDNSMLDSIVYECYDSCLRRAVELEKQISE